MNRDRKWDKSEMTAEIERRDQAMNAVHLMNYVFKSICELIRPHKP